MDNLENEEISIAFKIMPTIHTPQTIPNKVQAHIGETGLIEHNKIGVYVPAIKIKIVQ